VDKNGTLQQAIQNILATTNVSTDKATRPLQYISGLKGKGKGHPCKGTEAL
jgi:hypothetical protein